MRNKWKNRLLIIAMLLGLTLALVSIPVNATNKKDKKTEKRMFEVDMRGFLHNLHAARLISVALILMLLAGVIAPFSALDDMDSADGGEHTPEYVIFDGDYIKNDTLSGLNQLTVDYGRAENFTYVSLQPQSYSENDRVDP